MNVKMKGAYEYLDLAWHKNFSALVIPMAVHKHIIEGVNYKDFIVNHKDPFDFMLRVKVPRSCSLVLVTEDENGEVTEEKLQNVCRYYPSDKGGSMIKIMPPLEGKTEFRRMSVESKWLVTPCNDMKNFHWDINYEYYFSEVEKLLEPFNEGVSWDE